MILWASRSIEVENLAALSLQHEQVGGEPHARGVGLVKRWLPGILAVLEERGLGGTCVFRRPC
jgi:hypothetical protein